MAAGPQTKLVHALASGTLAAVAACSVLAGCGYRPVRSTLPTGGEPLHVDAVDDAALGAIDLGPLLQQELVRRLLRHGVELSRAAAGAARLRVRLLALRSGRVVVSSARQLAGQQLELQLEARLSNGRGETLWRSGLISVERIQPIAGEPGATGAAREAVVRALASAAASRCVALLTSSL